MARTATKLSKAEIRHYIAAVTAAGLVVTRTEISPDGNLVLHHTGSIPDADQAYEAWKGRKDARQA